MNEKLAYQNDDGDRWFLSEDPGTNRPAIKHIGNLQSGGHISFRDLEDFLVSGSGPEHQAVWQMLND